MKKTFLINRFGRTFSWFVSSIACFHYREIRVLTENLVHIDVHDESGNRRKENSRINCFEIKPRWLVQWKINRKCVTEKNVIHLFNEMISNRIELATNYVTKSHRENLKYQLNIFSQTDFCFWRRTFQKNVRFDQEMHEICGILDIGQKVFRLNVSVNRIAKLVKLWKL